MVGYPESLTDPSYCDQILVLTFPLIGNYGVPDRKRLEEQIKEIPRYFESRKIHIAALIVSRCSEDFSHYLAKSSLSDWLKENNIPALHGIDTRALTKKIRNQGVMMGKVLFPTSADLPSEIANENWMSLYRDMEWYDPNATHLVEKVSTRQVTTYPAIGSTPDNITILAVDVGMVCCMALLSSLISRFRNSIKFVAS